MKVATLDVLRCPFCGGHLEVVTSLFHRRDGDDILDGVLGCHCCTFAVVDGIPVMHLGGASAEARAHVEAGETGMARRAMLGLTDPSHAARFEDTAASSAATFRDMVEALGPKFEGGYFLYRFSDPSYVVAHSLVRAVAGAVLGRNGRAIDVCGGSGHLTRSMMDLSPAPPVLADLFFWKMWLARRFTAPGCEAVCCDANGPLPFARGAFRYAMCADAFMYIWTKRALVQDMTRLIDSRDPREPGAVMISHAHNALVWSPSHGNALPPGGYGDLFETLDARVFAEGALFADFVAGGPFDLSRRDDAKMLDADPALVIVASRPAAREQVFGRHPIDTAPGLRGELRVNPLYVASSDGGRVRLRLQFPTEDYAGEFGACREYLPDELEVNAESLAALAHGRIAPDLAGLIDRRVILDLPSRYY
jgi:uncharacterized protein YbaR (Trm112 family)